MLRLSSFQGLGDPPPFITSKPALQTAPLPDPPAYATPNPSLFPDRPAPHLVYGPRNMVNGGALGAGDGKVAWDRVMRIWGLGGGGHKVQQLFGVEQQRAYPSVPQR